MTPKLVIVFFGLLVLGLAGFFIFGGMENKLAPEPPKTYFDLGDAPDGQFPSLLASNGVRVKKTDEVFLGQAVNVEEDSKQVNLDEGDDGVKLNLNSCKQSTAYFFVRIKNPGRMTGIAYLNLYADWNNDGKWSGSDECAPEWVVRNFPIDLAKQANEIAVYAPQFIAGKNIDAIWYRGAVTLNQKMNEAATGEFASGEFEDYGPKLPGDEKYYNFYCMPDPLKIKHGDEGEFKILPDLFSEPISEIGFGQNFQQLNFIRKVTLQKNIVKYESSYKDVDPPKRSDVHFVDLKVSFAGGVTQDKSCTVIVEHDELTIETPSRKSTPVPQSGGSIKTESPTSAPIQEETHPIQEAPGFMKN
ncbi:MAG: hypothetical protein Q8P80_03770 [Candidatus Levybacteria bacterium]|nr:hypothetical protein [Candidatus Levybacteria bacterium]